MELPERELVVAPVGRRHFDGPISEPWEAPHLGAALMRRSGAWTSAKHGGEDCLAFCLRRAGHGVEATLQASEVPGVDQISDLIVRVSVTAHVVVGEQAFLSGREGRCPGVHGRQVKRVGVTVSSSGVLALDSGPTARYPPRER